MNLRTDLACESILFEENKNLEGIVSENYRDENSALEITRVKITSPEAARKLQKPTGNYVTLKFLTPVEDFSPCFESRVKIIAEEIKNLCGKKEKVLVAGLGNRQITPDAVGPVFSENIFPTAHIKKYAKEIDSEEMGEISVITPGVMGKTGIEASLQIKALCEEIKPEIVLAADALACSDLENLGCTIQLSDTGISPGSGVENARKELSRSTLGVTCIAAGIPTVVDLSTAAAQLFNRSVEKSAGNMMVTPRNIDRIVEKGAKYLAYGVNLAFLPTLSVSDLESLIE